MNYCLRLKSLFSACAMSLMMAIGCTSNDKVTDGDPLDTSIALSDNKVALVIDRIDDDNYCLVAVLVGDNKNTIMASEKASWLVVGDKSGKKHSGEPSLPFFYFSPPDGNEIKKYVVFEPVPDLPSQNIIWSKKSPYWYGPKISVTELKQNERLKVDLSLYVFSNNSNDIKEIKLHWDIYPDRTLQVQPQVLTMLP